MKLVATCKLIATDEEKVHLIATLERVNAACNWLAEQAFRLCTADKIKLQHLFYRELRERFDLHSQHAVRVISKVCEVYKRDKSRRCHFQPHGAIALDQRLYTFKHGIDRVSLAMLDGRMTLPVVVGDYHRARLEGVRGQADLIYRNGKFFLFVTVEVPNGSPVEPKDWLGVDLGIRNLATDSDGGKHSGNDVEAVRQRYAGHRARLQQRGTRSAKRRLRKIAGREARFRSIENHRISKSLVAKSKGTERGIALEDLKGIRDRVTVRKAQRARHAGWAFFQLRAFISYKARLEGVEVRIVDPRNTSRTCLRCGHIAKENRRSQSEFECVKCSFAANADVVGAINIARRAAVNRPTVSDVKRETVHRVPRSVQIQSFAL